MKITNIHNPALTHLRRLRRWGLCVWRGDEMKKLFVHISVVIISCIMGATSHGEQYWAKTYGRYGGTQYDKDKFYSVQQTSDNGYIISFYNSSLLKLDSSGVVQWQKKYRYGDDFISSVQQTSDGGYIMAGYTDSSGAGDVDGWLLKLDSSGNIPECDIIGTNNALVTKTTVIGESSNITPVDSSAITNGTSISPQDTLCTVDTVCFEETGPCPSSVIYGEHSEQTEVLRHFRDNVLDKTQEGKELIKLYYQWSPLIAKAMESDESFKQELKDIVDNILPSIEIMTE